MPDNPKLKGNSQSEKLIYIIIPTGKIFGQIMGQQNQLDILGSDRQKARLAYLDSKNNIQKVFVLLTPDTKMLSSEKNIINDLRMLFKILGQVIELWYEWGNFIQEGDSSSNQYAIRNRDYVQKNRKIGFEDEKRYIKLRESTLSTTNINIDEYFHYQ